MRLTLASLLLTAGLVPAQISSNVELLSQVNNGTCTTTDVWAIGDYILVARVIEGFQVLDVSDPANPVVSNIRPPGYPASPGTLGCSDIKSDGRYIYVTDEATGEGVFIYDGFPDPMNPTYIGSLRGPGQPAMLVHNLWVEGDYLFAQDMVYDVSDRANPQFVTQLDNQDHPGGASFTHDVVVKNDRAYLSKWDDGFEIWNVADPVNPVLVGAHTYPDAKTHNAWPSEDGNYLYTTDEQLLAGIGGFVRIFDISDLDDINEVGTFKTGPTASVVHNVHVNGDLLFIAYYKEGVRVCSIADPANPVEIGYYDTFLPAGDGCHHFFAGVWGVYPFRKDMMVVGDLDTGVYIMRLDPIAQQLQARFRGQRSLFHPTIGSIDIDFTFQNNAPAALDAFGVLTLSSVNGQPLSMPLLASTGLLNPAQTVGQSLQIPVPTGLEGSLTLGFTGYTGIASPIVLSEEKQVSVTIE